MYTFSTYRNKLTNLFLLPCLHVYCIATNGRQLYVFFSSSTPLLLTLRHGRRIIKKTKHGTFGSMVLMQFKPIWVGDIGTRQK